MRSIIILNPLTAARTVSTVSDTSGLSRPTDFQTDKPECLVPIYNCINIFMVHRWSLCVNCETSNQHIFINTRSFLSFDTTTKCTSKRVIKGKKRKKKTRCILKKNRMLLVNLLRVVSRIRDAGVVRESVMI